MAKPQLFGLLVDGIALALNAQERGKDDAFSSGSIGYSLNGRVEIDGKSYQFSGNAVQVGTKGLGTPRQQKNAATGTPVGKL